MGTAFATSRFGKKRLKKAIENIAWAFPEWDDARVRTCAIDSFRTLFGFAAEFACAPRITVPRTAGQLPPRVELGETNGAIKLLVSGRPCVMISGHCGNWEVLGATVAALGIRVAALYRPLNQAPIDAWVRNTRSARGLDLIDKFGAAERIVSLTANSGSLGFIADQNAGRKGIFVPFFGRLASTYKTIGLVAIQSRMPLICGQAKRLGGPHSSTLRYRVEVTDVIHPEDWESQPDPLFYVTARYRRAIERMVRASPEQYLWMHGAWKTRPKHERTAKPFPPALLEKLQALPWMTDTELTRITEKSAADSQALAAQ